ncbi:MAG: GNAT family N-acetyltransferase, partial [Paraglaciecola sp.]|nr:GNAT family N-acetyltransferase [Paraglaciecola sp.]
MFTVDEVLTKHYPNLTNKPLLSKPLTFLLRRLLHEREMQEFAQQFPHVRGIDFVEQVLDYFKISYS